MGRPARRPAGRGAGRGPPPHTLYVGIHDTPCSSRSSCAAWSDSISLPPFCPFALPVVFEIFVTPRDRATRLKLLKLLQEVALKAG